MDAQSRLIPTTRTDVSKLRMAHKRADARLFAILVFAAFIITPLLVFYGSALGASLLVYIVGALAILVAVASIICWPAAGLYITIGLVVLIEEEPLATPILTDHLYVFYWPTALEGFIERPIGVLFISIILIFICRALLTRKQLLRGGPLFLPFVFFLLCVVGGVIYGLMTGGNLKMTALEIRPFWYLFVSYILAYNLITKMEHVRTLIWIIILGAGIKALQGIYIYLVVLHGDLTNVNSIMEHLESFFFVALVLLLMLLWVHYRYRPQFYVALLTSPFVLIALIANKRRADYIALLVGMAVAWAIIFWIKPQARKWLVIGMLAFIVVIGSYIAAFANSTAGYAAPAHAIVSIFFPSSTDLEKFDSNLYRTIENNDLKFTVKQSPLIGFGFGKPFLEPVPLTSIYPDILKDDPVYNYVPHNTIYWVWMRLGAIGFLAFWYLLGSIIVRGCLIARRLKNPYFQVIAIYTIAVIFMEVVVAYADYQLYFYRNVIYVGLLVGVLMRLPTLDKNKGRKQLANDYTHSIS